MYVLAATIPSIEEIITARLKNLDTPRPARVCANIYNLDREDEIGLGTSFDLPELRLGECYIHQDQGAYLGVEIGDQVQISMYIERLYDFLIDRYN